MIAICPSCNESTDEEIPEDFAQSFVCFTCRCEFKVTPPLCEDEEPVYEITAEPV